MFFKSMYKKEQKSQLVTKSKNYIHKTDIKVSKN